VSDRSDRPRVALVHDYLTQRGGAERVALALADAFPGAPLYTSLYEPTETYPEFAELDVRPAWLSRVGVLRRHHRFAFPLLAPVMSGVTVDADVAICSSSGWAHGARVTGRRVVYCHAPARWLYQRDRYVGDDRARAAAVAVLGPSLRRWDARAAARADRYLVNSTVVAASVRDHYGIDAEVLPPPVMIDVAAEARPLAGVESGAWLCVSRLLAYKNVEQVVRAFDRLPDERLVVVGDGPDAATVRAAAPGNVQFVGTIGDAELRWLYSQTRGTVAAAYEDFGLTPLEAAAFGRPSAVYAAGGYLDTVVDGETGVHFDAPEPEAIAAAVARMAERSWDADALRAHAARFSLARFGDRMREVATELAGESG
jgi:glycosyltransferase involved in cell wall biosynthesis